MISKYVQFSVLAIALSFACLSGVSGQGRSGKPSRPGQSGRPGPAPGRPGQPGPPKSVKTFRFRKRNPSARSKTEKDLIRYFSRSRKNIKISDMGTTEFGSLNSSQKTSILRNMPDIDILQVQGTNLQGAQLKMGSEYLWDQINPNVKVAFKGQLLSRRIDASSMRMLEADAEFSEKIQNDNKTESIIVWSILANLERILQIATDGPPVIQWDINNGTNFLYEGDMELNSEQARNIENGLVEQIWAGNLTADYLSTKTSLSSKKLRPMVKKMIRIQNPIIDEAAYVIREADIPSSKMREVMKDGDMERLLQDPDMRVDILEVVKAKKMKPNIKVRIESPPGWRGKRSVDSGNEAKDSEDESADEELIAKFKHILDEEKAQGLQTDKDDYKDDDDAYIWNNIHRILAEPPNNQERNEYGLNRTKRDLAHRIMKRKMYSGRRWSTTIKYRFGITGRIVGGRLRLYRLDAKQRSDIRAALSHWESETCLRFQYYPNVRSMPHLLFLLTLNKKICGSSPVGRRCCGNKIFLRCWSIGVIAHEIGHSLGFWHEHSRPDRDDYVYIKLYNVADWARNNFIKHTWRETYTHGVPYDYGSAMHYPSTAFAQSGKKSIVPKDSNMENAMGQRKSLSFWDFKLANLHFCLRSCSNAASLLWNECKNSGYRDPKACNRCKCPTGFKGDRCQFYDTNTQVCGTTERTATAASRYIYSPGYVSPGYYSPNQRCVWILKAPAGHQVRVQFNDIFVIENSPKCTTSHVELRYGIQYVSGPRYCGTTRPGVQQKSVGRNFMVLFHSGPSSYHRRGFKLKYSISSCGICDGRYSPSLACKTEVLKSCYKVYHTKCGWFGLLRCTRKRLASCPSIHYRCCHGKLYGRICVVECGGCKNKIVRNQPACRHRPVLTRSKRVKYHVKCGLFGWGRCTRYKYVSVTYLGTTDKYYCCQGYRLSGSRCIK